MSEPQRTVGFVGLGNMGRPMAGHLAKAGFRVIAFDQDQQRLRAAADEHGLLAAGSAADFAAAEAVITMLPNGRIVREALVEWDGGIVAHLRPGSVVVDMSSAEPAATRRLGEELAPLQVLVVDAPVSGAVPRAETGTLSIMLGTDDDAAAERVLPFIDAMSERVFRTGELGSGHAMKALNNYVASAGFVAAVEALMAGERFGLRPEAMVEVFNASTGRNFTTENVLAQHVVSGQFATGFALALMTKDVGIAAELMTQVDRSAPVCHAVHGRLESALAALGAVDHTAAIRHWETETSER